MLHPSHKGALRYGRRWWAPFTSIAAAVMLTLLAPDAYLVFGWAFLSLILAAVGGEFGTRRMQRPVRLGQFAHRAV